MADQPTLASLRRKRPADAAPTLFDAVPELGTEPEAAAAAPRKVVAEPARGMAVAIAGKAQVDPARDEAVEPVATRVFTVSSLVRQVRSLVERSYVQVTVEGEISNWRPAGSGHCYFTLKDRDAQLSVVLFRRQAGLLRFRPKDGDAVRVSGSLSVYESRGQMQLMAEFVQQTGLGAMLAAVQELKARLKQEGLFVNQRPLPPFPRCIGVVTSLQGAALRDIVKVCRRRHAGVNLLVYPAAVQGPRAARELAAGIRWFSAHPERADVVLLARGGGSWEDLHAFDDEALVRAIAACAVPVLTGIGHATDTVLADAAADMCAPTPSAAAELVTAAQHNIAARMERLQQRLVRSGRYNLLRTRQRFSRLSADMVLRRVNDQLNRRTQQMDELGYRAESAGERVLRGLTNRVGRLEARLERQNVSLRLAGARHRCATLEQRLGAARLRPLAGAGARLDHLAARLETLSPLRVLERGYALVYGADGRLLRSADEAPVGSGITAQLGRGRLSAQVTASLEPRERGVRG